MSQDSRGLENSILSILELLANDSSHEELVPLLVPSGTPAVQQSDAVHRSRQLGLRIFSQLDRSRRRESSLHFLIDTAHELAAQCDLDSILHIITRRTRLLLGTDMAYICLSGYDDHVYRVRAADGYVSGSIIGSPVPECGSIGSVALSKRAPFWTADYLADERISYDNLIDDLIHAEQLRAVLAVPLSHCPGSHQRGVLYAGARKVRHFTADEIGLTLFLTALGDAAIEKANLIDHSRASISELKGKVQQYEAELNHMRELARHRDRLFRLVRDGGDLHALLQDARRELGGAVQVRTADGSAVITVGAVPDLGEKRVTDACAQAHAAPRPVRMDGSGYAVPLVTEDEDLGTLLAFPSHPQTDLTEQVLGAYAETAVLLRRQMPGHALANGETGDEFLDDMLARPPRPRRQVLRRAQRLGVDLNRPYVVAIAHTKGKPRGSLAHCAAWYAGRVNGLKTVRGERVILLVPGADGGSIARSLGKEMSRMLGCPVTVSASEPASNPELIYEKYQEALRCFRALIALGTAGRAASARELGFAGVLLSGSHNTEEFIESVIGPLLVHDRQRSTDLVATLEAYFAAGGSPTHAAAKLYIHPNTVARRLERIGEVLGPTWQDSDRALEIHLALRLLRIRNALPSAEQLSATA